MPNITLASSNGDSFTTSSTGDLLVVSESSDIYIGKLTSQNFIKLASTATSISSNLSVGGTITASNFIGSGAGLSNINIDNVSGIISSNRLPFATSTTYGTVVLSDSTNTNSSTTAASSAAVKAVFDLASSNSSSSNLLINSYTSTSTSNAPTAAALSNVYALASQGGSLINSYTSISTSNAPTASALSNVYSLSVSTSNTLSTLSSSYTNTSNTLGALLINSSNSGSTSNAPTASALSNVYSLSVSTSNTLGALLINSSNSGSTSNAPTASALSNVYSLSVSTSNTLGALLINSSNSGSTSNAPTAAALSNVYTIVNNLGTLVNSSTSTSTSNPPTAAALSNTYTIASNALPSSGGTMTGTLYLRSNISAAVSDIQMLGWGSNIDYTNKKPTYSWNSASNTGMCQSGTNKIGFLNSNFLTLQIASNAITSYGTLTMSNDFILATIGNQIQGPSSDTAAIPTYTWSGDTDTGIYQAATGQIGFTANGISRATISTTVADFTDLIVSTSDRFLVSKWQSNASYSPGSNVVYTGPQTAYPMVQAMTFNGYYSGNWVPSRYNVGKSIWGIISHQTSPVSWDSNDWVNQASSTNVYDTLIVRMATPSNAAYNLTKWILDEDTKTDSTAVLEIRPSSLQIGKDTTLKSGVQFFANTDSKTNPSYTWTGDSNTGIYKVATGQIGFATGGSNRLTISSNAMISTVSLTMCNDITLASVGDQILGAAGSTASQPTYTWTGDSNTGLYRVGAGSVGIATGGSNRLTISSNAMISTVPLTMSNDFTLATVGNQIFAPSADTAAIPTYTWSGDSNTGLYRVGASQIGFATSGSNRLTLTSNGLVLSSTSKIVASAGTSNAPSLYFSSNSTTGFWQTTSNNVGISSLGSNIFGLRKDVGSAGSTYLDLGVATGSSGTALYMAAPTASAGKWWAISTETNGSMLFTYTSNASATITSAGVFTSASDDRIKSKEVFITDSISTLMKLKPQVYEKHGAMEYIYDAGVLVSNSNYDSNIYFKESGLIAQEMFYDAPELRHLIVVPSDADPIIYTSNITSSTNPDEDPLGYYQYWGTKPASINYTGIIPYLIQAIQDLVRANEALSVRVASLESQ